MRTRVLATAAVLALLLSACADDDDGTDATATKSPSAAATSAAPTTLTFQVDVDAKHATIPTSYYAMFPKALSARPGDTVSFALVDTGEPHTVAFGATVDKVFAFRKANPKAEEGPPEEKQIPELFPDGPGDVFQAAAQPCVLPAGAPPVTDFTKPCANTKPIEFTGLDQLFTSGWMGPDAPFTFVVAAAAVPGTYNYLCQLHGPDMGGTLTVVAPGATVPSPAEVKAKGEAEKAALTAALAPAYAALAAAKGPRDAVAGTFAPPQGDVFVQGQANAFGPAEITVPVGGKVTWNVLGPHTIAFNAPADAVGVRIVGPDGVAHRNEKAEAPAASPGQKFGPQGPSGDPVDGGRWNGEGYRSSGILLAFEKPLAYSITFTKAGTYKYLCQIHIDMEGTVKVG
ncbi:MAG TPA: hypothetical protein VNA14_09450 [Mycobacteriales bacterium]|nr:hypothetical protein [Mycobacteriales bacterium]